MLNHRILWVFALLAALAANAVAKPEFLDLFKKNYNVSDTSKLGQAACGICHSQPPKRNAYGRMLEEQLDNANAKELTVEMLAAVESLSATNDGVPNIAKIKDDVPPTEPDPNAKSTKPKEGANQPKEESPLIPNHTFHPTLVHFPIALFIFGAFLDFIGARKALAGWRQAGYLNFLAGLVSTIVVIPTGIIAMLRLGYPLEGTVLQHLLLGSFATILMAAIVAVRRKSAPDTTGYWVGLLLAVAAVGVTGHWGGMLVYG